MTIGHNLVQRNAACMSGNWRRNINIQSFNIYCFMLDYVATCGMRCNNQHCGFHVLMSHSCTVINSFLLAIYIMDKLMKLKKSSDI
jgi:hypothetical protein